jgi:hypothetical protein
MSFNDANLADHRKPVQLKPHFFIMLQIMELRQSSIYPGIKRRMRA